MAKRKNRKVTAEKSQNAGKHLKANRKYKDTVFRMLFSDRKNLLSLYNAVNGTTYDNPSMLEIVTLENAVYIGMKNDLSFIVNTNLFLYEETCCILLQSIKNLWTINLCIRRYYKKFRNRILLYFTTELRKKKKVG